jgi:DNA-binding NtrC family response regulator
MMDKLGDPMNSQNNLPPPIESFPGDSEVWILIVDDEPGDRQTLADILLEKGYHVETAATGQEGLEKLRGRFFQAALLDIRLPDMYGTELLDRLKELHPDTAAIMVTGYASLQTSMRALNSGAYAYLLKPLDFEHLLGIIQQALEQQRSVFESRRLMHQYRERISALESREAQLTQHVHRLEQELATLREAGRQGRSEAGD